MLFGPGEDIPNEFDYVYLMNKLSGYSDPWGRIRRLLNSEEIVRVKKGLYIPGPQFKKPFSRLILANLVFGPSYVSYASALSHYGLIPEAPVAVWSVTTGRKKHFKSPVGEFEYFFQNANLYAAGMSRIAIDQERFALLATPEKALFDFVKYRLGSNLESLVPTLDLLITDLRLDESALKKLSLGKLKDLSLVSKLPLGAELANCIRKLK